MRNWGIAVTIFYVLVVALLLVPAGVLLTGSDVGESYANWASTDWIYLGVPVAGEALLLFLSVDTSRKRLKPRAHTLVSSVLAAAFLAILTFAAYMCVEVGIRGDDAKVFRLLDPDEGGWYFGLGVWACLWLFWGFVFYRYSRNSSSAVTQAVSWLLKGSVLELLVAVPCHIIVRHRKDCSAPAVTSFGISTGLAVMLLSFGPSVLFLYKKRLDARRIRNANI